MSHTAIAWAHARNSWRIGHASWEMNADLIEIDWAAMTVELSAINPAGEKVISHKLELAELEFEPAETKTR